MAFGTVILDEAHRARAQEQANGDRTANNLLGFMGHKATKARHVLLVTATPIQTDVRELWDLLEILNAGAGHVLGPPLSPWRRHPDVLDIVTGHRRPRDVADAWEWIRHAIPSRRERDSIFGVLRQDLNLSDDVYTTDRPWTEISGYVREELEDRLQHDREGVAFLQLNNPIVRHTILRRRKALEQAHLLRPIAVDPNPTGLENDARTRAFFADGSHGLVTTGQLETALADAERFCEKLSARRKSTGYLKSLLLQRICSWVLLGEPAPAKEGPNPAGQAVIERLRIAHSLREDDNEELLPEELAQTGSLMGTEREHLRTAIAILEDILAAPRNSPAADPKWRVLRHYLIDREWLQLGAIIFSQFFDSVFWIATSLAAELPDETVAVYAGAGRSGVFRYGRFVSCAR